MLNGRLRGLLQIIIGQRGGDGRVPQRQRREEKWSHLPSYSMEFSPFNKFVTKPDRSTMQGINSGSEI